MPSSLQPPDVFVHYVRSAHGPPGHRWLNELPRLQLVLADKWQLTLRQWLHGGRGACVLKAEVAGRTVVLKIPFTPGDADSERLALDYWAGDGAPRLLDADAASGALLIEWIEGDPYARQPSSIPVLRQVGVYLRDLLRPRDKPRPVLPSLAEKLRPMQAIRERAEARRGSSAISDVLVRRELIVRRWLTETMSASMGTVIHGDLHPRHLLRTDSRLVAIDPYGVIGDPARDVAYFGLFFREDNRVLDRLDLLADAADVDRGRVAGHAYAIALGAHRFRRAFGINDGRDFLERVTMDLGQDVKHRLGLY